jgi:aryl-alcohol dehydrogenase
MKITAAVVEERCGPFRLQELDLGPLREDEVLVRVAASGICHTDLVCRDQWIPVPLPAVLGHEGAGVVEWVGDAVTTVAQGDHVALSYDSCGVCPQCAHGRAYYCHRIFEHNFASARTDGTTALSRGGEAVHSHFFGQSSFATKAVAHERNVVKLDDSVPFEVVAPFGCGIQTGAGSVLNAMRPEPGSSIAVFGAGAVGLSAVMAARVAGCEPIVVVDPRAGRLELARELGATHVLDASQRDPADVILGITGFGVDFALEACGAPAALESAIRSLAPRGECVVVGAPPPDSTASFDVSHLFSSGRRIVGVVEGESMPAEFFPRLLELWRSGQLPVERMMRTYDFDEIEQAVHDAESGETVKPVLVMS